MRAGDSGVSLERADESLARIRGHVESTFSSAVVGGFGHFAGVIEIPGAGPSAPLLVASIDGVGTKVLLASHGNGYATVAGDIVRHGANDCLAAGARSLFFLDYIAWGKLDPDRMEEVARGMAEACRAEGCVLLGGETAEMPGLYRSEDFDLAGCMIGTVARDRRIDGAAIRPTDSILALPSVGLHTNGYSLARKVIFDMARLGLDDPLPESGISVGEALLAPHRSYTAPLLPLIDRAAVRGLAHITGGGIAGNLKRILPPGCAARLRRASWQLPALFRDIQGLGKVSDEDMFATFNLGVGYLVVVARDEREAVLEDLAARGESSWLIGEIVSAPGGVEWIE